MAHKTQIRIGVFETNSSSTHSITICTPEQLEKLNKKEYTGISEKILMNWKMMQESDLETYIESYITPGGEEIIIFGDYGFDG